MAEVKELATTSYVFENEYNSFKKDEASLTKYLLNFNTLTIQKCFSKNELAPEIFIHLVTNLKNFNQNHQQSLEVVHGLFLAKGN
jgi:hypothetical protein